MKDRIEELCEKADLPKPFTYSSFVWMRSLGDARVSAAADLGVSERTLQRWEAKVVDNLTGDERAELVCKCVGFEYEKRLGD